MAGAAAAAPPPAAPAAPAAGFPGPYGAQQGYGAGVGHGPQGAPIAQHPDTFVAHSDSPGNKIPMKFFYETNCPFCQGTIIDEFGASTSDPDCIQEHVKIDWIPFGNAADAGGAVTCQHGADECMGNRIHVCAKEMFGDDDIGMNAFVVCHETNIRGGTEAGNEASYASCRMPAGKSVGDIKACAEDVGTIFGKLLKMGAITASYPKAHVPWVVFHRGEDNLQGNLVSGVCARLAQEGRQQPSCCANAGQRLLVSFDRGFFLCGCSLGKRH